VTCLACSVVLIIGLALLAAVGGYFLFLAFDKMDEFAVRYEQQGYERMTGQVMSINEPIESPRVYTAQVLKINADVDADLAVMAQVLEIHGTVHGDIDFVGQLLVVKPGGVVKGDIRVEAAQVIQVQGVVEGEITGSYQVLKNDNAQNTPESTATDDAASDEPDAESAPPTEADEDD
jgi:hypothetical protein